MKRILMIGLLLISQLSCAFDEKKFDDEFNLKCKAMFIAGLTVTSLGGMAIDQSVAELQKSPATGNHTIMLYSGLALYLCGAMAVGVSVGAVYAKDIYKKQA